jgi:[protein-PII] uridylyltransferase
VLDAHHPDEIAAAADATAREAQILAPDLGADAEAVRAHLALLPVRYAAAMSPRAVVRHTLIAATRPGPAEVHTRVTPREEPARHDVAPGGDAAVTEGTDELDVVALDHPGWFAKVAGVVALHGGSIVAADAFGRDDGLAVDTFKVRRPADATGSWWARVEGDLADAAAGRLAVRARVKRMARAEAHRVTTSPAVATRVTVEPEASGRATVVEVRTLDRIGVLFAISSALAELELDVVLARIQTVGNEAIDVFHVRDADGGPLHADHVTELELAVTAAIADLD